MVSQGSKRTIAETASSFCLGFQTACCYFYHVLFVKVSNKTSPDSRGREIGTYGRSCRILLPYFQSTVLYDMLWLLGHWKMLAIRSSLLESESPEEREPGNSSHTRCTQLSLPSQPRNPETWPSSHSRIAQGWEKTPRQST